MSRTCKVRGRIADQVNRLIRHFGASEANLSASNYPGAAYSTRLCLRHIGDVTVILSKRGRNLGPKPTQILVTNLDEWIPRQVVSAYQGRWPVEQINRELKTDLGLGAHQVSREEGRSEKSFGIAVLAYLLLIRAYHQEILPGTSWSIAQLQHALRLRIITNQVEHNVKTRLTKARKAA